jgi:DinB superfamily
VPEKRADTLLQTMQFIEWFTLNRAWDGLSDEELFWEPVAGSWGVRRRAECQTATPFGDGEWVIDFDDYLTRAADRGEATEPMTTIGWLMWHIGSMPGRVAQLDFLGGTQTAETGWTSCYLSDHQVFTNAAEAVDVMRTGWRALESALQSATDEALERPTRSYTYSDEPGPPTLGQGPGRPTYGARIVAATLNEISHHGTQICMLRDLYRATSGRTLVP